MNIEQLVSGALEHLPDNYFSTVNLELKFNVGSGSFTVDPETGNYVQSSTPTTLLVSATEYKDPKVLQMPGSYSTSLIQVEGRLSNPKLMPTTITVQSVGTAKLTNNDGSIFQGTWKFIAITQNRINAYTTKRGTLIRGTITLPTAV
ncbi:MAG: hypothetical protein EBZ62_08925, partial [Sphingobacteriia bacterium]|jgi:hypothetical protein|nr:hypothetical protein [Sphingobacteriia bacterium]